MESEVEKELEEGDVDEADKEVEKGKEVYNYVNQEIIIQEALDSYAGMIWPAALDLCHYLETHSDQWNLVDKAVLEIGAGTGLVSVVASLLGAWVTATDLPEVLNNLRVNLCRNTRGRCRHTPQVAALSWGFDLESTYPSSVYRYDYVLAADVVYHHDFLDELLATMKHFCKPGTTLIWANKVRFETDLTFTDNFQKAFDTTLLAEDGVMKIFMATIRDEEKNGHEGFKIEYLPREVVEEETDRDERSKEKPQMHSEAALSCDDQVNETDLLENGRGDDGEKIEDSDEEEEIVVEEETDGDERSKGNPQTHSEAALSCDDQVNETDFLENGRGDHGEEIEDSDEEEEIEEMENPKKDNCSSDDTDETRDEGPSRQELERQAAVQHNWIPRVIFSLEKDVYHYVGQDIVIYESIDSYGGMMWPAALALCSFLENQTQTFNLQGKEVLELGAGTGLVAIVASLLGAAVTATDLPQMLSNLRANVMRNTRGRCRHLPQIAALSWGFDLESTYPSSVYRYDYVLAADVVYHHDFLDELLATMKHFCKPGTTLIWANKVRFETDLTFTDNFQKAFDTTLLAEDGEMKIFKGTSRESAVEGI
ncbi:unnamed protein product [Menidia menidia]|uniref:(Atlantic silverside) hypothetical protein n=1 Tax=Menidia menidia TaxID=238744 RepID=A0A8S4A733_9TELE|nr:unnamed protein product [Menidia menidia]